ncbi:hypothetical protein KKB40_02950 [Patescibacteria group bacterium]|nr:hypothetical protein [Patescibacteria group bacterium]
MPDIFNSNQDSKSDISNSGLKTPQKFQPRPVNKRAPGVLEEMKKDEALCHTRSPLSAFCFYPDRVKFANKDAEEKIILLLRKHPITNLGWIIIAFLMIIAPTFLPLLTFFEFLPTEFRAVFIIIWYLITTAYVIEEFLSWFFHVNIITDERIIEVDFANLFYREMTDANIDEIQDVTVEMGGAFRTSVNYGNIVIQTAAQIPKIEFEAVPQPDKVARILRELRIEEEIEKLEGRVR